MSKEINFQLFLRFFFVSVQPQALNADVTHSFAIFLFPFFLFYCQFFLLLSLTTAAMNTAFSMTRLPAFVTAFVNMLMTTSCYPSERKNINVITMVIYQ